MGITNSENRVSVSRKKDLGRKLNPFDRIYLISLVIEDFLDLSEFGILIHGYTFQKALTIRTRHPFFDFYFDILNAVAGRHS